MTNRKPRDYRGASENHHIAVVYVVATPQRVPAYRYRPQGQAEVNFIDRAHPPHRRLLQHGLRLGARSGEMEPRQRRVLRPGSTELNVAAREFTLRRAVKDRKRWLLRVGKRGEFRIKFATVLNATVLHFF